MSDQEKIDMVLEWAESHSNFDTTFIENINEFLSRVGRLTDSQTDALDNIIERFHIE